MRETIIIISIIAIILIGDISTKTYLNKTADDLIGRLENLKEKTIQAKQTNERQEIKEMINQIDEEWNKKNQIWSTIVMHQELDNIEQPLTRAKLNIEEGELEDGLQEIETVMFFINHVKQREKLSWKNIF